MRLAAPSSLTTLSLVFLLAPVLDAASLWSLDGRPSRSDHVRAAAERPFFTNLGDSLDRLVQAIWPVSHGGVGSFEAPTKPRVASHLPEYMLKKYGSDKVLRFETQSDAQRRAIAEIADALFLDVWGLTKDWVDIRLSQDSMDNVFKLLPGDVQWRPIVHHLASAVFQSQNPEEEVESVRLAGEKHLLDATTDEHTTARTNLFFQKFQPLNVIVPWMRLMKSLFPTHVRLIEVGTSWEGRSIPALRVGNHPHGAKVEGPRKVIVVAGGSHAREWISTSTVTYAAYELITGYGKNRQVTKLIEEFDFVFVPTLNPDGYVYTWEEDRLWRKNRQSTKFDFCPGVDLDRSFGFQWDGENTQGNPCSENYAGEGPFDAHESSQFAEWIRNRTESGADRVVGFFDLHSYSQQILYPYSYTCDSAPGAWEDLQEVGLGLEKAIYTTTYKRYTTTSACEGGSTLWPREMSGGGSLLDWIMSQGVTYSYQIKLRDTGSYGFLLPAKEIVPTGKEVYAAIQYFAQYLLDSSSVMTHEDSPSSRQPAFSHGLQGEKPSSDSGADEESPQAGDFELRR